jgi:hypothetical protein
MWGGGGVANAEHHAQQIPDVLPQTKNTKIIACALPG